MRVAVLVPGTVVLGCLVACSGDDKSPEDTAPAGDAAVWSLPGDARLAESTTTFTAGVSRLDCSSGVTGTVLEPQIDHDDDRVVVTFVVERLPEGAADCQGNPEVPYEVVLDEPLGDRELVDGACLPGGEAEATSHCRNNGVRWPVVAPAAIETTGFRGRRPLAYVLATGKIAHPLLGLTTWRRCAFEVEQVRRVNDRLVRVVGRESSTRCSSQVKRRALSERLTSHEARAGVEEVVVVCRDPYFVVRAVVQHVVS